MNRPENKYGDWATPSVKEVPFWRDDMTPEEYDVEREYYYIKMVFLHYLGTKDRGTEEYGKKREAYQ